MEFYEESYQHDIQRAPYPMPRACCRRCAVLRRSAFGDPVEGEEKYFTTPCYAHSVAVLAKAGYPIEKEVVESGMKALDVSLKDMVAAKASDTHGDFFTWPIVFACECSIVQGNRWRQNAIQDACIR